MIYFDNASTTSVCDAAYEAAKLMLTKYYANPSSLHNFGLEAENKTEEAKSIIASSIGASPDELIFTSGGTEANNTAVFGITQAYRRKGNKVITLPTEHPSVLECFKQLKERGFDVLYAPIDDKGNIIINEFEKMIDDDVIFVSIMSVNNEIGLIQNTDKIGKLIKDKNPETIFHVDNVQGFGKHRLCLKYIDLMSMSAHKIHGAKGCGALYIKKGTKLKSLIFGGHQQGSVRPGTENTPGICAMGAACREAYKNIDENLNKVKQVRDTLYDGLLGLDGVFVNGDNKNSSPYILSLSFKGIKGEVLLHSLEQYGIYASTGSACSLKAKKRSSVIDFLDKSRADSTVRFSFSAENNTEQADYCAQQIKKIVPVLRQYKRR